MRIALLLPANLRLADITLRVDLYQIGLTALGHESFVVCRRGAEDGFPYSVVTFDHGDQLRSPEFWRSLRADVVLMVTWARMVPYLEAARAAGQRVVAITDSDGIVSAKLFFRSRFIRDWIDDGPNTRIAQMAFLWDFAKVYFYRWRREDMTFIRSTELSERMLFWSEGARDNFERCLKLHGRNDLVAKLRVSRLLIDPSFFVSNADVMKARRAVAIGRWDSGQKDVRLLARALARYYDNGGDWEVEVLGTGEPRLLALQERYPLFHFRGKMPSQRVAELLTTSRVLLCTSQYESGPIVAYEALASGCTLVTTPFPTMRALLRDGQLGTVSASHRNRDFCAAMTNEFSIWDCGLRSADAIARRWRAELQPRQILQECLDGL